MDQAPGAWEQWDSGPWSFLECLLCARNSSRAGRSRPDEGRWVPGSRPVSRVRDILALLPASTWEQEKTQEERPPPVPRAWSLGWDNFPGPDLLQMAGGHGGCRLGGTCTDTAPTFLFTSTSYFSALSSWWSPSRPPGVEFRAHTFHERCSCNPDVICKEVCAWEGQHLWTGGADCPAWRPDLCGWPCWAGSIARPQSTRGCRAFCKGPRRNSGKCVGGARRAGVSPTWLAAAVSLWLCCVPPSAGPAANRGAFWPALWTTLFFLGED